jgi:hypothetical protein
MSPPPGFVTRGCKRAFLVADSRDVTAVELFEWCYPRRSRRKRVRLSVRDGDERSSIAAMRIARYERLLRRWQ